MYLHAHACVHARMLYVHTCVCMWMCMDTYVRVCVRTYVYPVENVRYTNRPMSRTV